MTDHEDPRSAFPEFYQNPIVGAIADVPRWTVSDNAKVPINMRELMSSGRIWGAHEISEQCLVTLDDLTAFLPNAANAAFYLRAQTDGFVVLDIEKTCPPEVAAELLRIPGLLVERSMSGLGYHLLLPLPSNFWQFPIATSKTVLKHEQGWYEILLDHWVTFTRRIVPAAELPAPDYQGAWEKVYAELASTAVETPSSEFDFSGERPQIPRLEQIVELLTRRPLEKGIEAFGGDSSRFEFSTLGALYNRLPPILVAICEAEPTFVDSDEVRAWIIYEAVRRVVPHRDKHDETREGMPLLLNSAVSLVALRAGARDPGDDRS